MTKAKISNHREFIFDLEHHGDEYVINEARQQSTQIVVDFKKQTGKDEFRHIKYTFVSGSQMERLLPTIMKVNNYHK